MNTAHKVEFGQIGLCEKLKNELGHVRFQLPFQSQEWVFWF